VRGTFLNTGFCCFFRHRKVFDCLLLPVVLSVGVLSFLPAVLGSVLVFVCFAQGGCLEARYMAGKVTTCSAYVGLTVSGDPLSCSGLAIGCYQRFTSSASVLAIFKMLLLCGLGSPVVRVEGVVGRGCARHAVAPVASMIGSRLWSRDFAAGSVIGSADYSDVPSVGGRLHMFGL
jgi:hypothetical protein